IAARVASFCTASRAERLVPTNSTLPPSEATPLIKAAALAYRGWVFSILMIWILLRSPKMKGAIFGFQKRVWCPKWTPASSICRMDTLVILKLLFGLSLRVSLVATLETRFRGTQPQEVWSIKTSDMRVGLVLVQCV